ncbi:ankyrin repeat domain-containing protein [Legionella shakespearei]|uniref:Ankyrin repeats (3 copies) n=1 Tax=Legionella shakespearei DSM 23087 TaxID=1122169 RepID=A0A0W0YLW2_9GAMM|nr:ankyrin repeat domain-containing protein [Legionella shakespearei]KTD57869.1 Ankyrin repeats (3 copies) [Legionella shakespearei DSM 23087]
MLRRRHRTTSQVKPLSGKKLLPEDHETKSLISPLNKSKLDKEPDQAGGNQAEALIPTSPIINTEDLDRFFYESGENIILTIENALKYISNLIEARVHITALVNIDNSNQNILDALINISLRIQQITVRKAQIELGTKAIDLIQKIFTKYPEQQECPGFKQIVENLNIIVDNSGMTPLTQFALNYRNIRSEIRDELLISFLSKKPEIVQLNYALLAGFRHSELVMKLIEAGAQVTATAPDRNDSNIFHLLVKHTQGDPQDKKLFETLLAQGPSNVINATDRDGNSALILAAAGVKLAWVELLLKLKADPNVRNHQGNNALHSLMMAYQPSSNLSLRIINLLHSSGTELDAKNKEGNTPIMLAATKTEALDWITLLLDLGASVVPRNSQNLTVFNIELNPIRRDFILRSIKTRQDINDTLEREASKTTPEKQLSSLISSASFFAKRQGGSEALQAAAAEFLEKIQAVQP